MKKALSGRARAGLICAVLIICCGAMAAVDGLIRPGYAVKSAVKAGLFLLLPAAYVLLCRDRAVLDAIRPRKSGLIRALVAGGLVYGLIIAAYFLLRGVFDFSGVTAALTGGAGVSRDNFVAVSLYIALVNSLLEELLFRGFGFLLLRRYVSERLALVISSACFAFYHAGMLGGWFSPLLYALTLAGLFAGGAVFCLLDRRGGVICSWAAHICANFGINTIGLILFGLL